MLHKVSLQKSEPIYQTSQRPIPSFSMCHTFTKVKTLINLEHIHLNQVDLHLPRNHITHKSIRTLTSVTETSRASDKTEKPADRESREPTEMRRSRRLRVPVVSVLWKRRLTVLKTESDTDCGYGHVSSK